MITPIGRSSQDDLQLAADIVLQKENAPYDAFIDCKSKGDTIETLTKTTIPWHILKTDKPIAVFALHTSPQAVVIDQLVFSKTETIDHVASTLANELTSKKTETIVIPVADPSTEILSKDRFHVLDTLIKCSGHPVETKFMPILPLINPSQKSISDLAELMNESYESKQTNKDDSHASMETLIRDIFEDRYGSYLEDCSYASGMSGKIVSACLVTRESPKRARIVEMFTHPLYRARGLATSEITMAMNKLANRDISTLTGWVPETDAVTRRLLRKLDFSEGQRMKRFLCG